MKMAQVVIQGNVSDEKGFEHFMRGLRDFVERRSGYDTDVFRVVPGEPNGGHSEGALHIPKMEVVSSRLLGKG